MSIRKINNRNRRNDQRTYGQLYRRHLLCDPSECFYCGDTRYCLDHRPPISLVAQYGTDAMRSARIPLCLMPCCADCNRRRADRALFTVTEALSWLEVSLEREYERKATLWSEPEIAEMSPEFQRVIRARKGMLDLLLLRVRHAQYRRLRTDLHPEFD